MGALSAMAEASVEPLALLRRHAAGDWGESPAEDARENALSVRGGFKIMSSYPIGEDGARVWVLTEADRSSTCLLLPEAY